MCLRRSPVFLRVVHGGGKWDALDQVGDKPTDIETIYAYRMSAHLGAVHVRASHGQGGFFTMAEYKLCDPQPADADMRSRAAWEAWVEKEAKGNK